MDKSKVSVFCTMDLTGAVPTPVPMQTVEVEITSEALFADYAKAFVNEARRVAPLRAEQVNLTVEEMSKYCAFLLYQRVQCVHGECDIFRKLKVLYIPTWIQHNISMIGEVIIRGEGLKFVPVMDDPKVTLEEAIAISEKIGSFEDDLQIVQDAMPRSTYGDVNVMTTAVIAGYVKALHEVAHPAYTYVTAFLGMRLRQEAMFSILYRKCYDDIGLIAASLIADKRVMGCG